MKTRSTLSAGLCLALALVQPMAARADDPRPAAATAYFDEARALMEKGEYAPACPKLEASQSLDPQLGTQLHLGHCYEKSGQLAAAYHTFLAAAEVAAQKNKEGKDEPREKVARERAESLAERLSLLDLRPSEPVRDQTITIDGKPLKRAQWGEAVALVPGEHVLRASAPGHAAWQQTFTIGAPARLGIRIPALAPETVNELQPSARSISTAVVTEAPRPQATPPVPVQRIIGYVALGAGVAGLGLGTVFGLLRNSRLSQLEGDCNLDQGRCVIAPGDDAARARIESLHDQARAFASGANVAWILGSIAAGSGLVLILTAPREEAASVTLGIAPGGLTLTARTNAL